MSTDSKQTQTVKGAREMSSAIGQEILVRFEQVSVVCRVEDVKQVYGKVRLLIAPIGGTDQQWIEMDRVRILDRHRPHAKVPYGQCPVCGHYGEDCTGKTDWSAVERILARGRA